MISVVIVDDHQLVRQGIRSVLERVDDMVVVGEAGSGEEAMQLVDEIEPDVVVVDISMPGMSGLDVSAQITASSSRTAVVVLSMHQDGSIINKALKNGALGYVLKESAADELLLAIRAASRGATYLGSTAGASMRSAQESDRTSPAPAAQLTKRELEVLQLIGKSLTNRAISRRLDISIKTVERHRTSIMAKLDAHTVVELIRLGLKYGLISFSDEDEAPETTW